MHLIKYIVLISLILLNTDTATSHEPKFSDRTDLGHIIASYSEREGIKFVLDPRVKARVNMIGLDINQVSKTNLIDIFLLHSFTAHEKDGVVYVLPQTVADNLGEKLGPTWKP